MKIVFWAVSIIIILGGCLWLYRYVRRTEEVETDYFTLLKQLAANPQDDAVRSAVWKAGRKFYKNRMSGIDESIEIDIEQALRNGAKPAAGSDEHSS
ncbi:hypothetical protein [Alicyclobacillus acidiphilus]|uniref:hypothetical protein n=1 Tax=Alicyclobacillus acidiphilus TaxID=182455 RepID=UPI00082E3076|nr:hypothetical protein [Alicyclobacillus acidiphilus]